MGFFSKLFKGVKKVFKKIGKGIKKVATKVGKFMNRIGVVGQIAMAFILPGIGSALASTLGNVGTWAAAALANPATNALVKGVAHVVNGAAKFAAGTARVFNTVTSAVKNFTGEVGKTLLNKVPGISVEGAATNIFGQGGALDIAAKATGETWNTTIGSSKWWDSFARSPENIPPGFTGPPELQREYTPLKATDDPMARVFTDPTDPNFIAEGAYGELPASSSLLQGPITPQAEAFVAPDIPASVVSDVAEDVGKDYLITERSLAAAGTEAVKAVGQSLMAPEQPEYDYSGGRGAVVVAENAYEVQPGQPGVISQLPAVGYGMPMVQYDALYKPAGMYSRRMQGLV